MTYESQAALLADLNLLSLATATGKQVEGTLHQTQLLVEHDTQVGPVLVRVVQPYYVLADGTARFGQLQSQVLEFLTIKQELADAAYGELDAAGRIAALQSKVVRLPLGQREATWKTIQYAVGLPRAVQVKAALVAIGAADQNSETPTGVWMVINEINRLLDPEKQIGADPASEAFRNAVDAMAGILAQAGQALTVDEIAAIKALGEQPWTASRGITVRPYIVEALTA